MVLGGDEFEELGCTSALDYLGSDTRDTDEPAGQPVVEHVLADRDKDGAEEQLTEERKGCADGYVLPRAPAPSARLLGPWL